MMHGDFPFEKDIKRRKKTTLDRRDPTSPFTEIRRETQRNTTSSMKAQDPQACTHTPSEPKWMRFVGHVVSRCAVRRSIKGGRFTESTYIPSKTRPHAVHRARKCRDDRNDRNDRIYGPALSTAFEDESGPGGCRQLTESRQKASMILQALGP
ncbi:hypothetical protein LY78DRAFT_664667, partial [Colletotrichum sublineola]